MKIQDLNDRNLYTFILIIILNTIEQLYTSHVKHPYFSDIE